MWGASGVRSRHFEINSSWKLHGTVEEIAAILEDPLSLTRWWGPVFMKGELVSTGNSGLEGVTVRFFTKGLLPHTFQFTAQVARLDEAGEVVIRTWGDFDGVGHIAIEQCGSHVWVDVNWSVTVEQPYIRFLLAAFKPVFTANHRWAMRRGREGLQAEIARRRGLSGNRVAKHRTKPTFPHNLAMLQRNFRWCRDGSS